MAKAVRCFIRATDQKKIRRHIKALYRQQEKLRAEMSCAGIGEGARFADKIHDSICETNRMLYAQWIDAQCRESARG